MMKRESSSLSKDRTFKEAYQTAFHEYLSNCTLAGCKYLVDDKKGKLERWMWFFVICTALGSVGYVLMVGWTEFITKPVIITLESTQHPIGLVPFPAVALCNINLISKRNAAEYAKYLRSKHNSTRMNVEDNVYLLGRLLDFGVDDLDQITAFNDYLHIVDVDSKGIYNTLEVMKKLAPSCNDSLIRCRWRGREVDCGDIFQHRRTSRGFCCTFNYIRRSDESGAPLAGYLLDDELNLDTPGHRHGLSLIVDPQIADYAYPSHASEGFDVVIFNPWSYPDMSGGSISHAIAQPNSESFFILKAATVRAVPDVKRFSVNQRGCRFTDEFTKKFHGRYSYSDCIVMQRLRTVLMLCKCAPYYLPGSPTGVPRCNLGNIYCLNKYKQKLMFLFPGDDTDIDGLDVEYEDSLYVPDCAPDCAVTRYKIHSYYSPVQNAINDGPFFGEAASNNTPRLGCGPYGVLLRVYNVHNAYYCRGLTPTVTAEYLVQNSKRVDLSAIQLSDGVDLTDKSVIHIYYASMDTDLYKMDVVYYWYEIVSNFGGICGLFLGFSLISIIEIFYYIFIRFFVILRQIRRKYE